MGQTFALYEVRKRDGLERAPELGVCAARSPLVCSGGLGTGRRAFSRSVMTGLLRGPVFSRQGESGSAHHRVPPGGGAGREGTQGRDPRPAAGSQRAEAESREPLRQGQRPSLCLCGDALISFSKAWGTSIQMPSVVDIVHKRAVTRPSQVPQ